MSARFVNQWKKLGKPIYTGERLKNNLTAMTTVSVVCALMGLVMAIINLIEDRGFVTLTSYTFMISGTVSAIAAGVFHKRSVTAVIGFILCIVVFTYYVVSGETESVASLWVMAMPIAVCYFINVRSGIFLSIYYEVLVCVLFYTPGLRERMGQLYSQTFMTRYPIVFLCVASFTIIAMISHHSTALRENEYAERLNLEIEQQKKISEELARVSAAQSRFFSSMSHEIRTPLNAIIGYNEMILREHDPEAMHEDAQSIEAASQLLLHLINDILDMSQLESGQMELVSAPYRSADMIADIANMMIPPARSKSLELSFRVSPDIPDCLVGDEVRNKQILINVINNAIKYTREGSVTVTAYPQPREDGRINLVFEVADTGIGIKKESIPYLFTAYKRADEENNKYIEGTGLGLSIVKQLLILMGGEVAVESEYGKGSTFTVTIPQQAEGTKTIGAFDVRKQHEQDAGSRYRRSFAAPDANILLVDDTPSNIEVATKLLRDTEIRIDTAESGAAALQKTLAKHYDVILLDHFMPGMDGVECLHGIRKQDGGLCRAAKVIALTANAGRDNSALYLKEGFDGFLAKPYTGEALEQILRKMLPRDLIHDAERTGKAPARKEEGVLEFEPEEEQEESRGPAAPEEALSASFREGLQALGISAEDGLRFSGGDGGFYKKLLREFGGEAEERAGCLQTCLTEKDWKNYRIQAHSLKSTSATIGASAFSGEARSMEEAAGRKDADYLDRHHGAFLEQYRALAEGILKLAGE